MTTPVWRCGRCCATGSRFPVVHDAGNVLAGRFRVTDLPATFVIDGAGRIAWVSGPGQSDGALDRAVAAVAARL